jgi:uncharacterized protein YfaS (alpha-2-macroglobulin family)
LLGSPFPTPTPTDTPTATATPTETNTPTATPTTQTPTNTPTDTPTTTPTPDGSIALTVKTDKDVYSFNQNVRITVDTKDSNGEPLAGANISVLITSPTNKLVASLSGTTDSSGTVLFTYRTKRNVGNGTYTIDTTASKDGFVTTISKTTFRVE